jgi:hypothetical protein
MQEPMIVSSMTMPSSYLNKAIISLDYMQIGNVVDEENDKLLITDSKYGYKFTIPSYKVIPIDKTNSNTLIVDIEYQEAGRYRIVE